MPDSEFLVGAIYEDCAFHPVLCTGVDGRDLYGISLVDGTAPRSCDLDHCGPVPLTVDDVLTMRTDFERYVSRRSAGADVSEVLHEMRNAST